MREWLVDHGWKQWMSDPCIYTFRTGDIFAMIARYIDDIPAACTDTAWMQDFKVTLGARFKIKDLGDLSQLLGMHITRDRSARIISMDQSKYVKYILIKHNMFDCKPSSLPMELGFLSILMIHLGTSLLDNTRSMTCCKSSSVFACATVERSRGNTVGIFGKVFFLPLSFCAWVFM
jgi:hypothetical protein